MPIIAAAPSESKPLPGQDHRSGPNFTVMTNPGGQQTISCPIGITFDIKRDKTAAIDPTIFANATNGTVMPANTLIQDGHQYYIANPKGATGDFVVTITEP